MRVTVAGIIGVGDLESYMGRKLELSVGTGNEAANVSMDR